MLLWREVILGSTGVGSSDLHENVARHFRGYSAIFSNPFSKLSGQYFSNLCCYASLNCVFEKYHEHKRAVSQGDSNASPLAEHVLNTGHQIDWSDAMVLDSSHFTIKDYISSLGIYKNREMH